MSWWVFVVMGFIAILDWVGYALCRIAKLSDEE